MAPIVLKVKGNNQLLPFNMLDSDDLSKTWRVCTKVKDSLENGSRLENLSWRLWFSHNVNNAASSSAKAKKPACKAAVSSSPTLRNFKVPEDFDFQSQKKVSKDNNNLHERNTFQQSKQPTQKLQIVTNMDTDNSFSVQKNYQQQQYEIEQQQQQQQQHHQQQHQQQQQHHHHHTNHQQQYHTNQQIDLDTRNGITREEFTLHQYTSDQAGDQVVELEDIFGSFGEMQAYLDSGNIMTSTTTTTTTTTPTTANNNTVVTTVTSDTNGVTNEQQQTNALINTNVWNISQQDPLNQQQYYSSSQQAMHSNATTPIHVSFNDASYNTQQQQYYNNNYPCYENTMNSALYVSSDTMPPIPIGTLHNKLLATLPRETLESAEKLFEHHHHHHHHTQSTPTTPYTVYQQFNDTDLPMNNDNEEEDEEDPFELMMLQYSRPQQVQPQYQSKSLPPSRATSPPPINKNTATVSKRNMNGSASDGKAAVCSNCSTTSTPLWRRSANDELLCNACGLYLKLHNAPRPKYLKPQSVKKDTRIGEEESTLQPLCSNCGTSTTPLWRRDIDGSPLCNACGLYLKLHHEKRPLSMKTDSIKKRQRCDHTTSKSTNKQKKNRNENRNETIPTTYSPYNTFGLATMNQIV